MTKLETIARALLRAEIVPDGDEPSGHSWRLYLPAARIAVKAMRKCTNAMIRVGWQEGQAGWGEGEDVARVWESICEAILKEKV